jgi:hypothetical protein
VNNSIKEFCIKRPLSTGSHRSLSTTTDGIGNTPCSQRSFSSNQEIPIVHYQAQGNNSKDNRLKRAAVQERRQATREC